uniref:Uncharacterized protein n=1 Tax=Oryza brachyantha TaxID=4533 RepID=J3L9M5_ORYBR
MGKRWAMTPKERDHHCSGPIVHYRHTTPMLSHRFSRPMRKMIKEFFPTSKITCIFLNL